MNREIIGKKYIAKLNPKNSWVQCEDGNNGEKDYYKDVYDNYGRLVYCEEESCEVVGINHKTDEVELTNLMNDEGYESFTIKYEQFIEDFVEIV